MVAFDLTSTPRTSYSNFLDGFIKSNYQVLVLKLLQAFFNPRDVARDLCVKPWVYPAPFSTADDPNKMVPPTVFAHKRAPRILLTGVNFSTGTEFSRLGNISSIERVALAGPHTPNLLKQTPEDEENTRIVRAEFKDNFVNCKSDC